MLRFSLTNLQFLLNLCTKHHQKHPNWHKDIVEYTKTCAQITRLIYLNTSIFEHMSLLLIPQTTNRYDKHTIFLSLVGKIAGSRENHEE